MTSPRRRVLRAARQQPVVDARAAARRQKREQQLDKERAALDRWMGKLRRAFHAVERQQRRVTRLERQILGDRKA